MSLTIRISISLTLAVCLMASGKKVKMEDLPALVQAAVKDQTKGAMIVGFAKEVENGKTSYEAETKLNGKTRDLEFDPSGKLLAVEEEVNLTAIPAAAKQAIEKKAAGGVIKKVEKITQDSTVSYEAAITKKGKTSEVTVNPDGTSR